VPFHAAAILTLVNRTRLVAIVRNLIFISHRIPFPPDRGEKIRGYNLITHFARYHNVYLGCLIDDPADAKHVAHLRTICTEVAAFQIDKKLQKLKALARIRPGRPLMLDYYFHPGLQRWATRTAAEHPMEVVYIFCTAMAPYGLHLDCSARILDMQDIDSEKWAEYSRNSRWPARLIWQREAHTLLAYERHAAMHCDLALLVTEEETRRFAELAPETSDKLNWVQMGVDIDRFSPNVELVKPYTGDGPHLVFTGNMDYWPNADAVTWFAADVFPLIRDRMPGAQFHIVGANPGPDVLRLANQSGVHVTGRVPDVRPYVMHADVSVAPLRMARGVQNKVLEAMALGRPVVASRQAFEGVRAVPGRDLLVADGAEAMAGAILAVIDGQHPGLGAAARSLVEQTYTWPATLARLDGLLDGLLRPRAARGAVAAGSTATRQPPA
jgi:sugar transferase (PEP-CTERM/EpsH1 system associated)